MGMLLAGFIAAGVTPATQDVLPTVKVPHLQEDLEVSVPGIFLAREQGGIGPIKTAIHEGKLVVGHLATAR